MLAPATSAEFETHYAALTSGAGLVNFNNRTQIEITGADRAQFLHNLCTNEVRKLAAGEGCEAFLLNVKGHIVGHVLLFVGPNSIVLETVPGQAEKLIGHLDRYLIREDVQLYDRSAQPSAQPIEKQWGELLLAGPRAEAILIEQGLKMPHEVRCAHSAAELRGIPVWIRRVDLVGPGAFLIASPMETLDRVSQAIVAAGADWCATDVFDTVRIEQGMPWYGRDISEETLPQEIDRNAQAISFIKGCYLGQETVARIDALGHVNRLLRGVRFSARACRSWERSSSAVEKPSGR